MSTIDYKALAGRIQLSIADPESPHFEQRLIALSDLRTVVSLLEGMAELKDEVMGVPPQPERQPLTNEQIDEIGEPFGYFTYGDAQGDKRRAFVRAIESSHGIGGCNAIERQPVSGPDEAQPMSEDYIRGYDAGFLVGAEKGRSGPTEAEIEAGFMRQIKASREAIKQWPEWMRREAHTASATLPTTACEPTDAEFDAAMKALDDFAIECLGLSLSKDQLTEGAAGVLRAALAAREE